MYCLPRLTEGEYDYVLNWMINTKNKTENEEN